MQILSLYGPGQTHKTLQGLDRRFYFNLQSTCAHMYKKSSLKKSSTKHVCQNLVNKNFQLQSFSIWCTVLHSTPKYYWVTALHFSYCYLTNCSQYLACWLTLAFCHVHIYCQQHSVFNMLFVTILRKICFQYKISMVKVWLGWGYKN